MPVSLKKIVREGAAPFDLRALPDLVGGGLLGALRACLSWRLWLFIVVTGALVWVSYRYVDRPVATWLHKYEKSAVTAVFRSITDFGSAVVMLALPFAVAVLLFLVAVFVRNPARYKALHRAATQALFVFSCVAVPAAIGLVGKIAIGRARPRILFDGGVYGFTPLNFNYDWHSMPSGHSLAAAGFAAGLAIIAPLPVFPIIAFFGAMIAFSRVATTAHYFGDALAGAALAIVCAVILKGAFAGAGNRKIFPTWDPNKRTRLRSISLSMKRR